MKKIFNISFALLLLGTSFFANNNSAFGFGRSACEPVVDCYDCAPNIPERLPSLKKCAVKNKPYNYYTWDVDTITELDSDRYDWAASEEK